MSEECGKIIRQVEESGEHQTKQKGVNNPVTIADLRVQKTLEVCLKDLYPNLKIQGEESKESLEGIEPCVDVNLISDKIRSFLKISALDAKHKERKTFINEVLRPNYELDEV